MEYRSKTQVYAEKSQRYINSLGKHFARKVPVDFDEDKVQVRFEMGLCQMSAAGSEMNFECSAKSVEALEVVKSVVGLHIIKFGELMKTEVVWSDE
ncbi:DUF2218 domain-containing protein [Leucothrix mucor]|uniref:DUF2218 domain-containing protein n=1 Tax=Leucothrix mucor TaxID=45248 RepID=UPI0003B6F56C|nr:DUF2218 domain-containing protein [Leucothrix mucor]